MRKGYTAQLTAVCLPRLNGDKRASTEGYRSDGCPFCWPVGVFSAINVADDAANIREDSTDYMHICVDVHVTVWLTFGGVDATNSSELKNLQWYFIVIN